MRKLISALLCLTMLCSIGGLALAERELVNNVYTEGLPIIEQPESFSLLVDSSSVLDDILMLPILEEQTGVKPEFIIFPYQVALERKSIMVASGDYPDAIGGWLLSNNDILVDGMVEGLYVPIEEYIDQFSPKMQEVLAIPGVRDSMTLPDGHIYTIPYVVGEPTVSFLPYINVKWLERLGLEMPTTTEEFTEVLRAFKAQDANGNGDPNDEIPFSSDTNNRSFGLFTGWFGENAHGLGSSPYYSMDGGTIVFRANRDAFKESIKYFASLYAEGLIDPEIFTQDLEMWKSKGRQDLYGVSLAYGAGDYFDADESLPKSVNRYPFEPLPVLKSEYAEKPVWRRNGYGVTTFRTQLAITDKAKNPGLIIRWFDNVFDLDNSIQFNGGLFGIAMEKLGDRQYRALDTSAWDEATRKKYEWGNLWLQSLPKYIPVEVKIAPAAGLDPDYDEKKVGDTLYEPYLEELPLPSVWVSQADTERMSILQTDIKALVDQKTAEWISGEKDIDAEWDAYCAQLNTMGLDELTQIKQRAIDAIPN